jgi:hypothetical protein
VTVSGFTWPKALGPEPGPAEEYAHPVPDDEPEDKPRRIRRRAREMSASDDRE